jgi:triosephosphate isomerase
MGDDPLGFFGIDINQGGKMKYIFINLKRFDVPKSLGGLCPDENSKVWIQDVLDATIEMKLGAIADTKIAYLLPESLLIAAQEQMSNYSKEDVFNLSLGCQGNHWKDVEPGKNFGAFTSSLPAAAVRSIGVGWSIIGHSEERRDKQEVMHHYAPAIRENVELKVRSARAVDALINQEARAALNQDINVLLCIGESAEERGEGSFEEQQPRIKESLQHQLKNGLAGLSDFVLDDRFVIGYEPIWAIGPGKTPPGKEYIAFVSDFIKKSVKAMYGFIPPVVYGGGLKQENAGMMASIGTLDGGLVALTQFTGEIGFDVGQFREIVDTYRAGLM